MVLIAPLVGAAVFLSGFATALPTSYDSSSNSNSNSNYGSSSSDSSNSNYGSSNSNSNYGSSNSNSNYGSSNSNSNSNYGSSNSNYGNSNSNNYGGNSNNYETSSSDNSNNYQTSSSYDNSNNYQTSTVDSTSTSSTYNSYQTPSYGSGSSNYWGGSGYEDCVNQCMAQFGSGYSSSNSGNSGSNMGGYYQATATSGSEGSTGTGATHTVIVAPSQGVFRMVPFATNASVGDTIEFHWGANEHTVTKSSALLPCNKSSEAPIFASGEQNTSFVFTQVVNDTNPIFYYCGTPGHCEKGMFGVINPAMAVPGAPTSLGGMMQTLAANDSELAAWAAVSSNATANNEQAGSWGENFDMSSLPPWSQSLFATNVMYTRALIGMNPDVYSTGAVDLSSVASTPLMLPVDLSSLDASTAPAATTADANAAATPAAAAASDPATSSPAAKTGGASALASPKLLVAGAVVLATVFAL
jgi:plastocyanin